MQYTLILASTATWGTQSSSMWHLMIFVLVIVVAGFISKPLRDALSSSEEEPDAPSGSRVRGQNPEFPGLPKAELEFEDGTTVPNVPIVNEETEVSNK